MNPATALATVLVDELVRHGVRDAVLCPGSRSAPLAFALKAADDDGRLRLHVRTDERSAAFLALGLAKGSNRVVAVVTTSGTAVANLHPAVLEASHTGVPLLLLTADRPPELRGTGANQTTRQVSIFGDAVRWQHDLGVPDDRPGQVTTWRSTVSRAVLAATAARGGFAGPVHLNLPLREPLVPERGTAFTQTFGGRADGAPWTSARAVPAPPPPSPWWPSSPDDGRTLVLVGDLPAAAPGRTDWGAAAAGLAESQGWPVVAEPSSAGAWARALAGGSLLLACDDWLDQHRPDRVVVVGRVTLARPVARLLRDDRVRVDLVSDDPVWPDPAGRVRQVLPLRALADAEILTSEPATTPWLAAWQRASEAVSAATCTARQRQWPTGIAVAATVLESLAGDSTLVVGSSNAVRDLDLVGGGRGPAVTANRGLAGIDGLLSTACGVALTTDRPTYALVGDLTFAHDAAALQVGPSEPRPDLTIVVVNDDGGGIFTLLEPGEPEHSETFERVFGTPLGLDLASLCGATGTPHVLVQSPDQLRAELSSPPSGLRVLEVRVDRAGHREARERLRDAAVAALAHL
ncbi:MAG TPA: 2-succinyl-5-enolpyruvyl-6-hydroxy-3-cyclohexene-1-carboxylic-acid synthase [Actinomycetales bacterium]|nr:2-succinyl-5-enolpyruvyl-6-hydroxy-3-cyclohexene-1-carboxylic-acid synthase [Actinomycetales bacterium]